MAVTQRGSVLLAADAAVLDSFGRDVALSSNGAILAVGANTWEGAGTDRGGVYIYDWNGSAWVARGSVIQASDAADSDYFGEAVALSSDGAILAVGANEWEGAVTGQGGVYIYDWNGSAWTQRGSVLTAADAVTFDVFGTSVSLSDNGSILAVGAIGRDGAGSNQGAVYIYDWNGSAWVQRGSAFSAADAGASDFFGRSVALSSDGAILAVGAESWDGTFSDQGGVYIYDWNGSAWTQRGSVLVASDAAASKKFGGGVALSSTGAVLVVGAIWRTGAYIYDWDGSAWVQRGSPTEPAQADGNYGYGVAVSATADVMVVGQPGYTGTWSNQGAVYVYDVTSGATGISTAYTSLLVPESGISTCSTTLTVELATGTAVASTTLVIDPATGTAAAVTNLRMQADGITTCSTDLRMQSTGTPDAPTSLTVSWPTGISSAPSALSVTASGASSVPTALAVLGAVHVPQWTARCLIDGVDVSAQLVDQASVTAEEGAARIARLILQPPSGLIEPLDYVGKPIILDYVLQDNGTDISRRLFTGRIDTPSYNPATTLLNLDCVDDLQNRVAAMDRTNIDALIGGRYTEAVQGEIDDNWDYAQARLSTVAASLDADASGGLRVTPWELSTTWATWSESSLIYRQASLVLPQRSTLINRVSIDYGYRYPRLRQRYTTTGWSGTQIDMRPCGWAYPTQQDIMGAAGGSGWTVIRGIFSSAPAAVPYPGGGFVYPRDDAIDLAILYLTQRHSQTVTEKYTLTVTAPESVAANGELTHALRGALASEFDGSAWESALDVPPLMETGGDMDHSPDATRADSDYAIQTLLDQANVKILGSHRGARVGNAVLCNPDLDLNRKIAISKDEVSAAGKVASVTHTLDFDAGSAVSTFELAIFGASGAGILTPDTLTPPAPPDESAETQDWAAGVHTMTVNTFGRTPYSENLVGLLVNPPEAISVQDVPGQGSVTYPNPYYVAGSYPATGFRVRMPGVDDADRNPLEKLTESSYSLVIPSDTLTFTIP